MITAKSHGITFSGPMVLAIMEGRKTQTRRLRCRGDTSWGRVGDQLWVREAVRLDALEPLENGEQQAFAGYEVDGKLCPLDRWPWKRWRLPSIHMPRGLSRATLEVTEVREQDLQDIDERDILAEGVTVDRVARWTNTRWIDMPTLHHAFERLWDHLNADRALWSSNPPVLARTFRVVEVRR